MYLLYPFLLFDNDKCRTASTSAPNWGIFKIDINIPKESLRQYGQLTLFLYEESADDGSRIDGLTIPLESF